MLSEIKKYISENALFTDQIKLLLGVSGGIDSMVMTHLLHSLDYNIAIAHCNFHLRGQESDDDKKFVKQYAEKLGIDFYHVDFNTKEIAMKETKSIQMVARYLRYNWFEKVRKENKFDYIAIAHNADDTIETFFINFIRGTGLRGLTGIKNKSGNIVRPLLFASRTDIETYAEKNKLKFREDSSNSDVKYMRNSIRHEIIPLMQKLNPAFRNTFRNNEKHLHNAYLLYQDQINQLKNGIVTYFKESCSINFEKLRNTPFYETIGFEILNEYNFNSDTINDILSLPGISSGKKFFSSSHVLITNRKFLEVEPLTKKNETDSFEVNITNNLEYPVRMQFRIIEKSGSFKISRDPKIIHVDFDKLSENFILRRWKEGDRFRPLGMKNFKKVSDFFTDIKLSINQKQKQWILINQDKIVWILGKRIDDRFKVEEKTQNVLELALLE